MAFVPYIISLGTISESS